MKTVAGFKRPIKEFRKGKHYDIFNLCSCCGKILPYEKPCPDCEPNEAMNEHRPAIASNDYFVSPNDANKVEAELTKKSIDDMKDHIDKMRNIKRGKTMLIKNQEPQ